MDALQQEQRGMGMSEVVKADARQPEAAHVLAPPRRQGVRIARPAIAAIDHQTRLLPAIGCVASSLLISTLTSQIGTDELRQENRPARAGGLGLLIDQSLPRGMNRAHNLKMAIVRADVAPAQSEDLPAAHPARQPERARQLKAGSRGALEQAPGDLE